MPIGFAASAVLVVAALAPLSPLASPKSPAHTWCPGQPWELDWGVNWDEERCHSTEVPYGNSTDLNGQGPTEWGTLPKPDQG